MALFAFLIWGALHTDLPQYDGKAMAGRFVGYPIVALLVPLGWLVACRRQRRRLAFPFGAAVLVTFPFVIDLWGNTFRLYIENEHFDDVVHAINPVLFVAAFALLLDRTGVPRWATWIMAFGIGCAGHILWETLEYWLLEGFGAVELDLSLADTLSDLGWGMVGAIIGACAHLVGPRPAVMLIPDAAR